MKHQILSLVCLFVFALAAPSSPAFTDAFNRGETLWMSGDHTNSVKAFRQALAVEPSSALTRALICRGLFEIGELLPEKARKEKLELYEEMIRLADEGVRIDSRSGECYFMRALGMGRRATIKGILNSLRTARPMEQDWLKSLSCPMSYTSPNGMKSRAEAQHALGLFYRLCPDASILQWLFGVKGDLNKAIQYSRMAAQTQPDQVEVILELGVVLVAQGLETKNRALVEEGRAVMTRVTTMAITKKTDEIDKGHARMLLAHPELCRDYDRQGQQERDIKQAKIAGAR
ncbi:MAG: hypothetical protein J0L75_02120 [Spirochaetes bacterium]|nr:hypothetical protein [Spirochaetota bacterium]